MREACIGQIRGFAGYSLQPFEQEDLPSLLPLDKDHGTSS